MGNRVLAAARSIPAVGRRTPLGPLRVPRVRTRWTPSGVILRLEMQNCKEQSLRSSITSQEHGYSGTRARRVAAGPTGEFAAVSVFNAWPRIPQLPLHC